MPVVNRMERIKELLWETKRIEISSLVSILRVSEATVRRDLERLEQEGFLYRTHGGAVLVERAEAKPQPEIHRREEKGLVGHIAAQLVEDNENIFIGMGSTCLQMAGHLRERQNLTIVTNNVSAAIELGDVPSINVILTGGLLDNRQQVLSLRGEFAISMIGGIFVTKCFLGVGGVDMDFGYSVTSPEEALLWRSASSVAEETIVVCDSAKFDKKGLVNVGPLDNVHRVITDKHVPDRYREYYYKRGIPIYTSYDLTSKS